MDRDQTHLPDGVLIAFYGDDFTGAAATLEVLAFAGLKSMLFLEPPTASQLERFAGLQAVGIASTARSQTPDWMDRNLPPAFASLDQLDPAIVHYKICTTLDSSPDIGSVGRTIEIAAKHFDQQTVPILVAAPQMRRYQVFGNLFAAHGPGVHRLDRHPVMARHPATPMAESDVGRHIEEQSNRIKASVISMESLRTGATDLPVDQADMITVAPIDCLDDETEAAAGRLLWNNRRRCPFVVGSQGVEYALVRHWQKAGLLPPAPIPSGLNPVPAIVAVSGSVSPTTADQIAWASGHGFESIGFNASSICMGSKAAQMEEEHTVSAALAAIENGQSPLIHTAEGPDDESLTRFKATLSQSTLTLAEANQMLGKRLGQILKRVLTASGIKRAVVSGGDTSGHATQQLDVFALSALAPTIPGASISRAHADGDMDGLELALKGGQMGTRDYFGWVRDGGGER